MKLSKTIHYHVRVRDYETIYVEVGATASHLDLGVTDEALPLMTEAEWGTMVESLRAMVDSECHENARTELTVISEWSEIEPNLAQDFLHTPPPAYLQRRYHHARNATKKADTASSSGKLRRGGSSRTPTRTPPPAA